MRFQIMREMELTMVPANLLRDPTLSLATKGAAAVLFSYADLHSTSDESLLRFWASVRNARLQSTTNCRMRGMGTCSGYLNFMIKRRNVAQPI